MDAFMRTNKAVVSGLCKIFNNKLQLMTCISKGQYK